MADKLVTELRQYRMISDKQLAILRRWFERLLDIDRDFLTEDDYRYGRYLIREDEVTISKQRYYKEKRLGHCLSCGGAIDDSHNCKCTT